jgi:hypothetical protein
MDKDINISVKKNTSLFNRSDCYLFALMAGIVLLILGYELLIVTNEATFKEKFFAPTTFDIFYWLKLTGLSGALVFISILFRNNTENSEDKSWRYIAILAFSLVGSVGVSIITSESVWDSTMLLALSVSLSHMGYWSWKREHVETSDYQEGIKETTKKLEEILNTMPDRGAFKIMADETSSIYAMTNAITILAENATTVDKHDEIVSIAKLQLKNALKAMCDISSLWTISEAKLFEANIMISISSDDIQSIPLYEEAFNNGRHFFPDLTSLKNISDSCESVLYVLTDIATNSKDGDEVDVKPLMLPVHIKSENHPGSIWGAPKAIETKFVSVIKEIDEVISNLPPNYVGNQLERIKEYFHRQVNCGSIISIPFTYEVNQSTTVDAVVNLYRPEEGVIKSPELFASFTKPLVVLISQLLYLHQDNELKSSLISKLEEK